MLKASPSVVEPSILYELNVDFLSSLDRSMCEFLHLAISPLINVLIDLRCSTLRASSIGLALRYCHLRWTWTVSSA